MWPPGSRARQNYPHAATLSTSEQVQPEEFQEETFTNIPNAAAHAEGGGGDQVGDAQVVVKAFVRGMVKGRPMNVLSQNGGTAECTVFLDRKLTTLSLARAGKEDSKKRAVPLQDISEIQVGAESGTEFGLPTTDLCVTLVLENGQAIAFAFEDEEKRDTFSICLSMFVDGRRTEVARREEKALNRA